MVTSARPSRAMSCTNAPGAFQTCRVLPESEVASMPSRPLDQTSSPRGDQASPRIANGPSSFTAPFASITFTLPLLSPRSGWSMKATRPPSGETRRSLTHPGASYSTFPMGYSIRLRFPTWRVTARLFPSGDQSASPTFSRISRGAPPARGTRASVPIVSKPNWKWRPSETASSPVDEIARRLAPAELQRTGFRALGPRREDVERKSLPRGGVNHRLAVGSEPRGRDRPARPGQRLRSRRARSTPRSSGRARGTPPRFRRRAPRPREAPIRAAAAATGSAAASPVEAEVSER